jgi:pyruvate kinase
MRRRRKVKIVATLGPSSSDEGTIGRLFDAGADVFRINMSHTGHDALKLLHERIRAVEAAKGRPIGILVDLQGPKLRIGTFADGAVTLKKGARFRLDLDETPGDENRVCLPHPEIFRAAAKGNTILLDDGRVRLTVTRVDGQTMDTTVATGGKLSNRKGVNVPDASLPVTALSPKDRADLAAAVNLGVDWIALSFVQRTEDVAEAKKAAGGRAAVMAKIEKPQALDHLDDILSAADGVMIARGDLGVELPLEAVPGLQKRITRLARRHGKPVVVATQMLESMISSPMPTRAEISDVSTAVYEGADAVMLSAESAAGDYPVEAVSMMNRVAEAVEQDPLYRTIIEAQRPGPEATTADAIMAAAHQVAETVKVASIVCYTRSGSTGLRAARERPNVPVLAFTPVVSTARRLALSWGIHCVLTEDASDIDDMVNRACRIAFREGFAKAGERVIVTAGLPFGTPGATNLLRVAFVGPQRSDG